MSPDERLVLGVITAARRRAVLLAAAEAAAWGAAVAVLSPVAGGTVALAHALWRSRGISGGGVARALERSLPAARNLLITAEELSIGRIGARAEIRDRVFADAGQAARHVDQGRAFPAAPLVRAIALAGVAWAVAGARGPVISFARRGALTPGAVSSQPPVARGPMRVTATLRPPSYTGLPTATLIDPLQLQAIEGTALTIGVAADGARVAVEHDGVTRELARSADGAFVWDVSLTRTGYIVITSGNRGRRLLPIVVSPDALPAVTLTAPGRDLRYASGNPAIAFDARATDDFGVKALALRYTKVSGSGEQFEFQEGEIPLRVTQTSARDWTGSATRSLADLNLKEGDMLAYRAVASDARPGDGSASSDAFFIEITRLGAIAGDAFTLPEEESKYALSQQMLIVKTERLNQRRASMAPGDVTQAAQNLAVEQRMIRAEFVFMLGGEVQDEEVEAEQSHELQEGRLQNRGQRDLRAATVAMSQAEKLLAGASIAGALAAERAAVAALQRAFSKDRYILRALGVRSRLDPTRRLTGNLSQAAGWRRIAVAPAANRRLAQLQDVLSGIAGLATTRDATTRRSGALVIAEQALRLDPSSAALRQIANDLQRAADASGEARARALASASSAAATEARRAYAAGTLATPTIAPALVGAFNDALSGVARGFQPSRRRQ